MYIAYRHNATANNYVSFPLFSLWESKNFHTLIHLFFQTVVETVGVQVQAVQIAFMEADIQTFHWKSKHDVSKT